MWLPANIVRGEVRVTHRALAAGHFCKAVPGQLKVCWLVNMNRSSLEISIYMHVYINVTKFSTKQVVWCVNFCLDRYRQGEVSVLDFVHFAIIDERVYDLLHVLVLELHVCNTRCLDKLWQRLCTPHHTTPLFTGLARGIEWQRTLCSGSLSLSLFLLSHHIVLT